MIKYLLSFMLFTSALFAAGISSQQNNYNVNEDIVVSVTAMNGANNDWIGIYPVGASNAWENVVSWKYTLGVVNGNITMNGVAAGSYEARAFFNNTFTLEASTSFNVGAATTSVVTQKASYAPQEAITLILSQMNGANNDWVGIYPVGSSNAWGNVVSWKFTNGIVNGNISLTGVSAGNYEARVFFNNSFNLEASTSFSVVSVANTTIDTSKATYTPNESITVTLANMAGADNDWVGIYPVGASNAWGNVVSWKYTSGIVNGNLTLTGVSTGEYEARAFFNNSYNLEATATFTVVANNQPPTVYEDAENGLADWVKISGPATPQVTNGNGHTAVRIDPHWVALDDGRWTNDVSYLLWMNNNTQKILSVDLGGDGQNMPHYQIGARVTTTDGARRLLWSSFYTHNSINAIKRGNIITFPSPVEQVRGWIYGDVNHWENFTVNLEDALHVFEPNNTILSVDYFYTTGGVLDNITLK